MTIQEQIRKTIRLKNIFEKIKATKYLPAGLPTVFNIAHLHTKKLHSIIRISTIASTVVYFIKNWKFDLSLIII